MQNTKIYAELLIFDLDGTLVNTGRDLANAVNCALRTSGKDEIETEVLVGFIGDGLHKLLKRVLRTSDTQELESAVTNFRDHYRQHSVDYSRPYPGVREVLKHFAGKKKAVLSNKPQEFTEPILRALDLYREFDVVVGGRPDLALKPAPEPVTTILERLEVQPERAVIIGDGETDILAGKAAGIRTCAVTYGFRPAEKLVILEPDHVIHNPAALMDIFSQ